MTGIDLLALSSQTKMYCFIYQLPIIVKGVAVRAAKQIVLFTQLATILAANSSVGHYWPLIAQLTTIGR